jgi:16S rRNA G966 N2-methylase RsmD
MNTLYYGDNLDILRRYVKDETVDLIYLDPPFKSNQDYNVLFKEESGERAAAQILAFEKLLNEKQFNFPVLAITPSQDATFKKARKVKPKGKSNGELDL